MVLSIFFPSIVIINIIKTKTKAAYSLNFIIKVPQIEKNIYINSIFVIILKYVQAHYLIK